MRGGPDAQFSPNAFSCIGVWPCATNTNFVFFCRLRILIFTKARGQNWYNDRQTDWVRRKARTQAPWLLHLAGDWHAILENEKPHPRPHLMRAMLVSNLDVEQRFVLSLARSASIDGCVGVFVHSAQQCDNCLRRTARRDESCIGTRGQCKRRRPYLQHIRS